MSAGLHRRRALLGLGALALPATAVTGAGSAHDDLPRAGRSLVFPRDHGAHLGARTEWWYVTGWLGGAHGEPSHGFQVTFFRSATGLARDNPSRFAARQLLFAHAAVTDLETRRHHHDQRIARWSGDPGAAMAAASTTDGDVRLQGWRLARAADGRWQAQLAASGFALALSLQPTQPLLLQGEAGFSRKGPLPSQASHYLSLPQLAASGQLQLDGRRLALNGHAWLDHEWSQEILHPDAVGWDWIGINLADGSALTAFVLRRADGRALWAGGSWRAAGAPARDFGPQEVAFSPGRRWRSPGTGADYPVQWQVHTPAGRHTVRALLDAQELDSRASTGTVYWEGLAELLDETGRRVGLGYLEMTGYADRLRLN